MPKSKEYVIRVTIPDFDVMRQIDFALLECLKHSGIVTVHESNSDNKQIFDIKCPYAIKNSKLWAEESVDLWKEVGFDVVAVVAYDKVVR